MKKRFVDNVVLKIEESLYNDFELKKEYDKNANAQLWIKLKNRRYILCMAQIVKDYGGRCIIVSAYKNIGKHVLIYHFDIANIVINVEVQLQDNKVESITPILKSADWGERELKEIHGIELINHPNLERIFLDERMSKRILENYLPLSKIMLGDIMSKSEQDFAKCSQNHVCQNV